MKIAKTTHPVRSLIGKRLIKKQLINSLISLLGQEVLYCRMPRMFPLMVGFDEHNNLQCWRYWELSRYENLIATDNNESEECINNEIKNLIGKRLLGFSIDSDYSLWLCFENDFDLVFFTDSKLRSLTNWELCMISRNVNIKISAHRKLVLYTDQLIESE